MGLGPIMSIYHARFLRYLDHRGILDTSQQKVWCFVGDGEVDEPETLGAINLASREKLDNLIFVINCNLQRLDGPVRGNGKIIQELEAGFRGSGWNVIKVIWGGGWDPLLAADVNGKLVHRMGEVVDGQYQKYVVEGGAYIREDFFGKDPELRDMVDHLSDEQLKKLNRGGHDPEKVYAAYLAAVNHKGAPSVILAKTIKGYGLGESGEGRNSTHQEKKRNAEELREFRSRFGIPISDDDVADTPVLPPGRRYARDAISARTPQSPGRLSARSGGPTFKPLDMPAARPVSGPAGRERDARVFDDGRLRPAAEHAAAEQGRSASTSCRSFPTRPARSAWRLSSASTGSMPARASFINRSMPGRWPTTAKPKTARSSKKGSTRPGRCRRSSPRERRTPISAST